MRLSDRQRRTDYRPRAIPKRILCQQLVFLFFLSTGVPQSRLAGTDTLPLFCAAHRHSRGFTDRIAYTDPDFRSEGSVVHAGKGYDEVEVGESFGSSLTVTETHIVIAAGLFGDFNPVHVDQEFAQSSPFGARILHGTFTGALMSAPAGNYFAGTAIAYLEQACWFKAPVRAGDTLRTTWTITERIDKPQRGGGIVVMTAECHNQDKELVAEAHGKMLVGNAG